MPTEWNLSTDFVRDLKSPSNFMAMSQTMSKINLSSTFFFSALPSFRLIATTFHLKQPQVGTVLELKLLPAFCLLSCNAVKETIFLWVMIYQFLFSVCYTEEVKVTVVTCSTSEDLVLPSRLLCFAFLPGVAQLCFLSTEVVSSCCLLKENNKIRAVRFCWYVGLLGKCLSVEDGSPLTLTHAHLHTCVYTLDEIIWKHNENGHYGKWQRSLWNYQH